MWNTWVEMNPETAHELGIENDDVVKIVSEAGALEAPVYVYPAIRPDTIAMPLVRVILLTAGVPEQRASIPLICWVNISMTGDLAFAGMKVKVERLEKETALTP